jgi:hypothetical protein
MQCHLMALGDDPYMIRKLCHRDDTLDQLLTTNGGWATGDGMKSPSHKVRFLLFSIQPGDEMMIVQSASAPAGGHESNGIHCMDASILHQDQPSIR